MNLTFREAQGKDKDLIRSLLQQTKLPVESLDANTTTFFVGEENGKVAGIAGYEFYGSDALLRSVAVPPEMQNGGVGGKIVDFMISTARSRKINRVVLLTETAQKFFERKGFAVVERSAIDNAAMKQSSEFTVACPKSALCMVLNL